MACVLNDSLDLKLIVANYMVQHMGICGTYHIGREAKTHTRLRICAVSSEPSLRVYIQYGIRGRPRPLALKGGFCAYAISALAHMTTDL